MGAWLLITVVAMTVVMWRLVSVAGVIWQERERVTSHCTQMETAALNGAILCERLPDGTTLLVMPGAAHEEHNSADPIQYQ
jgi:hypothetical protein